MQGDYDRTDLLWAATELPRLLDADRMKQLAEMIFRHQGSALLLSLDVPFLPLVLLRRVVLRKRFVEVGTQPRFARKFAVTLMRQIRVTEVANQRPRPIVIFQAKFNNFRD